MIPSPHNITQLGPNEIFVFGSNTSGRHGKGAAKTAMKWGAIYGQGAGLQGRTYGIPTVNSSITNKLPLPTIEKHVATFMMFAYEHPELTFLVTEIGCGLAGWTQKDIAPLFQGSSLISNIRLPKKFMRILKIEEA